MKRHVEDILEYLLTKQPTKHGVVEIPEYELGWMIRRLEKINDSISSDPEHHGSSD
jgi:hypothetical protein